MEREILFRGKRLDNGEWVYGYLFVSDTDNSTYVVCGRWCVKIEFEVDSSTIGQYTGLTDKNGVKIFEGDIITGLGSRGKQDTFVIRWSAASCGYTAGEGKRVWPHLNQATVRGYTVIGNIYDTPSLAAASDEEEAGPI